MGNASEMSTYPVREHTTQSSQSRNAYIYIYIRIIPGMGRRAQKNSEMKHKTRDPKEIREGAPFSRKKGTYWYIQGDQMLHALSKIKERKIPT